jgi:D-glycero-D-manno-heptose 1,7-bisphosphate phosphatase
LLDSFTDLRLGRDLLWRDVRIPKFSSAAPALFLDRDGVIIQEKIYIHDPAEVELLTGIPDLIRAARGLGMAVVEITNQAGIAHGVFEWPEFVQVDNRVMEVLAEQNVSVDAVFACPFHDEGRPPYQVANHGWRKPNPGMLLEAISQLNLAPRKSVLVGDKVSDLEAGRAAGLALGIHVLTGHGREHEADSRAVATKEFPVQIVERADQAIPFLQAVMREG